MAKVQRRTEGASALVAPAVDAFRLDNLYSLDARISKKLAVTRATVSLDTDVFNVLNANTTLAAQTNVASPNFQLISLNLARASCASGSA